MAGTCVISGKGIHGVFNFTSGFHTEQPEGRDLEQIAAEQQARLDELLAQRQVLEGEFSELCMRETILANAIAEAKEALSDIDAIAETLNPSRNRPR